MFAGYLDVSHCWFQLPTSLKSVSEWSRTFSHRMKMPSSTALVHGHIPASPHKLAPKTLGDLAKDPPMPLNDSWPHFLKACPSAAPVNTWQLPNVGRQRPSRHFFGVLGPPFGVFCRVFPPLEE